MIRIWLLTITLSMILSATNCITLDKKVAKKKEPLVFDLPPLDMNEKKTDLPMFSQMEELMQEQSKETKAALKAVDAEDAKEI